MIKKVLSFLFYPTMIALPLWLIGFVMFLLYVFSFRFNTPVTSDGIAVWTGGNSRISTGITLLQNEQAPRLLISGVNQKVNPDLFLGKLHKETLKKIHLGYEATTTKENALETADWVYQNNINSVILVTSFYHIPRSLLEFKHQLPNTTVYPYPIWPKDVTESVSWLHTRSAFQLLVEYHKFVFVKLTYLMKGYFL